jgi:hypothetical protein
MVMWIFIYLLKKNSLVKGKVVRKWTLAEKCGKPELGLVGEELQKLPVLPVHVLGVHYFLAPLCGFAIYV